MRIEWYSGTGCGGQNRNKVKASCRLTHLPSGIVKTSQCRTRETSYSTALLDLTKALDRLNNHKIAAELSMQRKNQMGSGCRTDRIRTYRYQDNVVIDHRKDKKASLTEILKGNFNKMW